MSAVSGYVDEHLDDFVDELCQLCRIPSFGANSEAMLRAAGFLRDLLESKGIHAQLVEVEGAAPYVVGTAEGGPGPSVLWFNHYDIADYTNPVVLAAEAR